MPRGLSAAAKAYHGSIIWAVKLTLLDSSVFNYAQESIVFLGVPYEPYLESVAPVRLTRTLEADSTEIELRNVDLTIGDLLRSKAFDGAQCVLKMLLLGINEEVEVLPRGVLREEEQDQRLARFQVTSRLDPSRVSVTSRKFTTLDFPIVSSQQIPGTSGASGQPTVGGCVLEGTEIVPLTHPMRVVSVENDDWVLIELANGLQLIGTPDHPIYSDRGKIQLERVNMGEPVITRYGLVPVEKKSFLHFPARKVVVTIQHGKVFWANGILSHNKQPETEVSF